MRAAKPKRGQRWIRKRTGAEVVILAVVDPVGASKTPVVIVDSGARVTCVMLDRFNRDYRR